MLVNSLFYQDNYLKEFEAIVKEVIKEKDTIMVVLDNTGFYPEGGGQPSDTGYINDLYVSKVEEKNGKIYHYVDKSIEVDTKVNCKIDFDKRFNNMQAHTGEHIVSGLICKKYDATNVGFHIGSDFITTMDFNKVIPQEDIQELEKEANEAIYKRIDVKVNLYNEDEVKDLEYRSKKELKGTVRLVSIEGYDICACCGVHVSNTSEIGIIKIIKVEKYKSGVRIYMLAGDKAIEDYTNKYTIVKDISNLLSLKLDEVYDGVNNLLVEIDKLKKEKSEIKTKLFIDQIKNLPNEDIVVFDENNLEDNDLKKIAELILHNKNNSISVVISNNKFLINSQKVDLKEITNKLRSEKVIRGGGNSNLVQGQILTNKDELVEIIKKYKE